MRKTFKYKLYSSKKTKHLDQQINIAAGIWNHSIALHRRYYRMKDILSSMNFCNEKKVLPAVPLVIGSLLFYLYGLVGIPVTPDSINVVLLQIDKIAGITPNELNGILGGFMGALASSVFDFVKALKKG